QPGQPGAGRRWPADPRPVRRRRGGRFRRRRQQRAALAGRHLPRWLHPHRAPCRPRHPRREGRIATGTTRTSTGCTRMKKTAAWLAVYALEQLGIRHTFGIPGVHNTELYDELNNSEQITPVLVTHEGGAAFMADAISRASESEIGTLVIVPAA